MTNYLATYSDRIKVISTGTGTIDLVIDSTASGYLALPEDYFYYVIEHENGTEWEVGFGSGITVGTLDRAQVIASSNADALVNFTAGEKRIFTTVPAALYEDVRSLLSSKQYRPYGASTASTSDDTPYATSVDFSPPLKDSGGISHLVATYTVAAHAPGPTHRKLWEGKIVIVDDALQSDTPVVLADPNSRSWSYTVSYSGGLLDFTVTGAAGVTVNWDVSVDVRDHDENGI